MRQILEEFLEIAERAELKYARESALMFDSWLNDEILEPTKVTVPSARKFKDALSGQAITTTHAIGILKVINAFYIWFYHTEDLSPFRRVNIKRKSSRARKRDPLPQRILSPMQISLLRGALERTYQQPYEYHKALTLFCMLLYMGITMTDIRDMQAADARGQGARIHVEDRTIPYTPEMRKLVIQFLAHRATRVDPTNPWLFAVGESGKATATGMRKILRTISQECGVPCTEKILLDTFAYNLAVDGSSVALIASLRKCTTKQAEQFISLAANSEDVTKAYLRSVDKRMRPVKRKVKRVDDERNIQM